MQRSPGHGSYPGRRRKEGPPLVMMFPCIPCGRDVELAEKGLTDCLRNLTLERIVERYSQMQTHLTQVFCGLQNTLHCIVMQTFSVYRFSFHGMTAGLLTNNRWPFQSVLKITFHLLPVFSLKARHLIVPPLNSCYKSTSLLKLCTVYSRGSIHFKTPRR